MNTLFVFFVLLSGALVLADSTAKFTTKYDDLDVDEILKNKRLFNAYLTCVLENVKCTPEGQTLKDAIPEALKSGCEGCSDKQKEVADRVIPIIINEHPADWDKLKARFDPEDKYAGKYVQLADEKAMKI